MPWAICGKVTFTSSWQWLCPPPDTTSVAAAAVLDSSMARSPFLSRALIHGGGGVGGGQCGLTGRAEGPERRGIGENGSKSRKRIHLQPKSSRYPGPTGLPGPNLTCPSASSEQSGATPHWVSTYASPRSLSHPWSIRPMNLKNSHWNPLGPHHFSPSQPISNLDLPEISGLLASLVIFTWIIFQFCKICFFVLTLSVS